MRKVLTATIVAMVLFAVGAFAANFTLTANDTASGSDEVGTCTDSVDVDVVAGQYDPDANDWPASVSVNYKSDSCEGDQISVVVEDEAGAVAASVGPSPIPVAAGTSMSVNLGDDVFIGDVFRVSVLINDVPVVVV